MSYHTVCSPRGREKMSRKILGDLEWIGFGFRFTVKFQKVYFFFFLLIPHLFPKPSCCEVQKKKKSILYNQIIQSDGNFKSCCTPETHIMLCLSFVVLQLLSHVQLFATPWTAACQASLSSCQLYPNKKKKGNRVNLGHCQAHYEVVRMMVKSQLWICLWYSW